MTERRRKAIGEMAVSEHSARNIAITVMLILMLYAISIFFYHKFEGWSYLDAAYFITMSITTIGYGDFVPHTDEGKIFTIFLAFIGISLAFLLIASIASYRERTIDKRVADRLSILKSLAILQRPPEKEKKRRREEFSKIPQLER
jgi:voltage-gated potassium channel Kch